MLSMIQQVIAHFVLKNHHLSVTWLNITAISVIRNEIIAATVTKRIKYWMCPYISYICLAIVKSLRKHHYQPHDNLKAILLTGLWILL